MNDEENEHRWLETGKALFARSADFYTATPSIEFLPPMERIEIAFWGRSNVGKSSLINALTGQNALARTSNTPGRTQELIFFNVDNQLTIVDMPGYGFAKAPLKIVQKWGRLSKAFLRGRQNLARVFLLVDGRHGIKENDQEHMKLLDESAISYVIVMTKADDVKVAELAERKIQVLEQTQKHPAAYPKVIVTSSKKGNGLDELKAFIVQTMEQTAL